MLAEAEPHGELVVAKEHLVPGSVGAGVLSGAAEPEHRRVPLGAGFHVGHREPQVVNLHGRLSSLVSQLSFCRRSWNCNRSSWVSGGPPTAVSGCVGAVGSGVASSGELSSA